MDVGDSVRRSLDLWERPDGYQLSWYQHVFHICMWWGWQDHFREIIGIAQIPHVTLDFAESWDDWTPV